VRVTFRSALPDDLADLLATLERAQPQ